MGTVAFLVEEEEVQVKAHLLRGKSKADLLKQLDELKTELSQLQVAKVTQGSATKVSKISSVRKSIAVVMTVINQTKKEQLRAFYKGKKYAPLDIRAKKTRAIRRKLNRNEATKLTVKAQKKASHFPMRKFAVKA
eukprot:Nk52_evm11s1020 gene=Nk52_evmTU11s1020